MGNLGSGPCTFQEAQRKRDMVFEKTILSDEKVAHNLILNGCIQLDVIQQEINNGKSIRKNFSDADEVKNPPKAKVEVVKLGNVNASKLVLELDGNGQLALNQQLAAIVAKLVMLALSFQAV